MATVIENLAKLGYALPVPHVHKGGCCNHVAVLVQGDQIFVGGQVPVTPEGEIITGKLGKDLSIEEAKRGAELTAVHLMAQIRYATEFPLENVRLCKLTCGVASTPDFHEHHEIADACSELFYQAMGQNGIGVREGYGVAALPLNACFEASAIFSVINKPKGGLFGRNK